MMQALPQGHLLRLRSGLFDFGEIVCDSFDSVLRVALRWHGFGHISQRILFPSQSSGAELETKTQVQRILLSASDFASCGAGLLQSQEGSASFTLTLDGETTEALAFDASAAEASGCLQNSSHVL